MREYDKDFNLPQIDSEKDLEDIFKGNNHNYDVNNISSPKNYNENSSKSVQEMKDVFSSLTRGKLFNLHNTISASFRKSKKLFKSSLIHTLISMISLLTIFFMGNVSVLATVILCLSTLIFSISGTVQFIRSWVNFSKTINHGNSMGLGFNSSVWFVGIILTLIIFPPFSFIAMHFMGNELKAKLQYFFAQNGLPELLETEPEKSK